MSGRVVGAYVLHRSPPPGERLKRGRPGRWQPVYDAIRALSGGEWFVVPGSRSWTRKEREVCIASMRRWLQAHKEEIEGVVVYETVDADITVADRRSVSIPFPPARPGSRRPAEAPP